MNAHSLPFAALMAFVLTAALPAQSDYDLFVKEFSQALKFNNDGGVQKAIRARPEMALKHFEALLVSAARSAEAEERCKPALDKLRALFPKTFECKTLEHLERYHRRLPAERVDQLYKTENQLQTLHQQWTESMQSGDREGILQIIESGLQLGRRIEEYGHKLRAAEVYSNLATFLNRIPKHTTQDTADTIEYAKMFLRQRESWEWTKDTLYISWKNWIEAKEKEMADSAKKEVEDKKAGLDTGADGLARYVVKDAATMTAPLEFKALKSVPEDSCFLGGPVPVDWPNVHVTDAATKLAWFKKRDVFLFRKGSNKLEFGLVDRDDGERIPVEAGAKIKPSLVYLEPGKKDPYCIGFFIGSSQQPFAGTITNIEPGTQALNVYYRSMSSWTAKLGDHEITFYDDNCDGKLFTADPMEFGFKTRLGGLGPKDEQPVAMFDSIRIGKRGELIPYSSAVKLGDQWWLLSSKDNGKSVEAKPLHKEKFETGTVHMKWSGTRNVKPELLIIRGKDDVQLTAFNIAAKKPVEVPVGEYYISYGRAVKGKGAQAQVAHVFRGSSEVIKVEKGKNTLVKVGGPFVFDFKKGGSDTEVELNSLFFQLKGVGGEVYAKIQGPTPAPEVVAARSSSGKGAKVVGEYVGITSPEMLQTAADTLAASLDKLKIRHFGINVGYFPVVKGDKDASTVMKFKVPFVGALIGLRQKKHKMFGKIGSVFK